MFSEDVLPLQAFLEIALMLAVVLPAVHLDSQLFLGEGYVDPEFAARHGGILSLRPVAPSHLNGVPENILRQRPLFLFWGYTLTACLYRRYRI